MLGFYLFNYFYCCLSFLVECDVLSEVNFKVFKGAHSAHWEPVNAEWGVWIIMSSYHYCNVCNDFFFFLFVFLSGLNSAHRDKSPFLSSDIVINYSIFILHCTRITKPITCCSTDAMLFLFALLIIK